MRIPLSLAGKLLQLVEGSSLPSSTLSYSVVQKMIDDGVVQRQQKGKTKSLLFINDRKAFSRYLYNHYSIADLNEYIRGLNSEDLTRAEAIEISGNSKLKNIRTFPGFLVNTYDEIEVQLKGVNILLKPLNGSYIFVHDYTSFIPEKAVTIVGVENPENFRYIHQQRYLFTGFKPLFVSRYPQSRDLVKWLQGITNPYLHFGDLDFEGLNIYLNEFKAHLGARARFFVPPKAEEFLTRFGNRTLYDRQLFRAPDPEKLHEEDAIRLLTAIHKTKKVLEQEVFIDNHLTMHS